MTKYKMTSEQVEALINGVASATNDPARFDMTADFVEYVTLPQAEWAEISDQISAAIAKGGTPPPLLAFSRRLYPHTVASADLAGHIGMAAGQVMPMPTLVHPADYVPYVAGNLVGVPWPDDEEGQGTHPLFILANWPAQFRKLYQRNRVAALNEFVRHFLAQRTVQEQP